MDPLSQLGVLARFSVEDNEERKQKQPCGSCTLCRFLSGLYFGGWLWDELSGEEDLFFSHLKITCLISLHTTHEREASNFGVISFLSVNCTTHKKDQV